MVKAFTLVKPKLSNQPANMFKLIKYLTFVQQKRKAAQCAMTEITSTPATSPCVQDAATLINARQLVEK